MTIPPEVLMVEDSAPDAELVSRAFKNAEVANPLKVVSSGETCLDYLLDAAEGKRGAGLPLLILLDLNLPGMSGIACLRSLKADERTREIPVVVLSHSEGDRDIMACVRLGSAGYIIKPLDIDSLVRVTTKLKVPLTLRTPPAAKKKTKGV